MHRASLVATVSEDLQRQILEFDPRLNTAVLRLPIGEQPPPVPMPAYPPLRLLAAGRLSREKGFDVLIEAMRIAYLTTLGRVWPVDGSVAVVAGEIMALLPDPPTPPRRSHHLAESRHAFAQQLLGHDAALIGAGFALLRESASRLIPAADISCAAARFCCRVT